MHKNFGGTLHFTVSVLNLKQPAYLSYSNVAIEFMYINNKLMAHLSHIYVYVPGFTSTPLIVYRNEFLENNNNNDKF